MFTPLPNEGKNVRTTRDRHLYFNQSDLSEESVGGSGREGGGGGEECAVGRSGRGGGGRGEECSTREEMSGWQEEGEGTIGQYCASREVVMEDTSGSDSETGQTNGGMGGEGGQEGTRGDIIIEHVSPTQPTVSELHIVYSSDEGSQTVSSTCIYLLPTTYSHPVKKFMW